MLLAYVLVFSYEKVTLDEQARWERHLGATRVSRRGGWEGATPTKVSWNDKWKKKLTQAWIFMQSKMNIDKV